MTPQRDWKYVSVRRTFAFVARSIERGTQWVVYEPNGGTRLTQTDILRGLPSILLAVAPLKPPEFVIIHIPQSPWRERSMPQFNVNPNRFDPYKNFKFRVKWENRYVAGVSRISALRRVTDVVEHREGGDPSSSRKSPGRTSYEPITLERGVTHDADFEDWANKVWSMGAGAGSEASLADFRKDIRIELYNEAGQLVIAYNVHRCWVSEFQALPDLDANTSATAIQMIKLEHEGFERDLAVKEPQEPSVGE